MAKPRPKKHHFVPRFYLEHFARDDPSGRIWTFDTLEDRMFLRAPKETAVESNLYSIPDADEVYRDEIEHWLSEVESRAAPLYPKVLKGEALDGQERADFSMFLSGLYIRSPSTLRYYGANIGAIMELMTNKLTEQRDRFDISMDSYISNTGNYFDKNQRGDVFEYLINKNYILRLSRKLSLQAIKYSKYISELFINMRWLVAKLNHQHLITSDNPVVLHRASTVDDPIFGDGGFLGKNNFITVPLSPDCCLELSWGEDYLNGVVLIDQDHARDLNRQRAIFSDRFLFTSVRDCSIRILGQKYKDGGVKMKVSGGGKLAPIEVVRRL